MTEKTRTAPGRTAFVSGAGRNIGRAITVELARRGFAVIVNGSRDEAACEETAEAVRAQGAEAVVAMADVGDRDAVRRLADQALGRFGAVDVVVNNAAIRPATPFLEMDEADWYRVLDVDLNAAFHTARAFLPGMVERRWGRIVNVTGMHSIRGYSGRAPVSAAKHGLWGLTKSLGKEFAPHGITANAISPGPIRGDYDDPVMARHNTDQLPQIPVGRLGEPEDIAALAGFLCSDEGGFVTAQMIGSNGGMET
jgi:3-oxoacyl-[acyl-carrier protein] reductase